MRVFINDKAVDVPRGARVRDAVAQADDGLARLLDNAAYVTDAAGRPVDAGDAIGEAGAVFRVVVSAKREGKPRLTKEMLRRWPKAELHVHLDGALRPATMLELARTQGIRLPADAPEALAKALLVRDAKSLEDYLRKYEITLAVLQTATALERVAYEFVLDVAAENVRYVEVRYSPLLHRPALTLVQAIEAPLRGIKRAEAETGTKVGLIVCGIRTRPAGESLRLARAAVDYRTAGLVAFDLAGAERGHPAREHRDAFAHAVRHGLAHTALGLTREQLARVVLNACESAFLPDFEKVALVSRVQSELEAL